MTFPSNGLSSRFSKSTKKTMNFNVLKENACCDYPKYYQETNFGRNMENYFLIF